MKFRIHHLDDSLERLEVILFHCMQRVFIEKWNHLHCKVLPISDDEHACLICPAPTVICLDDPAVQSHPNGLEYVSARNILAHVEFRDDLPPDSHIRVSLKGNVKTALPVDNPAM